MTSASAALAGRLFSPGSAYWNQRFALARHRERLLALSRAVNRSSDLSIYQFAQLFASVLEFVPDLILELGRGLGNSLCAFTEAANQLPVSTPCNIWSLCLTPDWNTTTVPKLRSVVPDSWFHPVNAIQCDILKFDYSQALAGAKRVLVFWDAHGFDVAEGVLGRILPEIADRDHVVFMHDMADTRYPPPNRSGWDLYGESGLWKGVDAGGATLRIGNVHSNVSQAIAIQDFAGRNRITLDSADHSIDLEIGQIPGRSSEMLDLVGTELFSLRAYWFWFTLNEHPSPYTFPRWTPTP